jgi:L-ornithine N5-oxygenase
VFAECPDPRIHHLQSYLPSLTPFGDTGPSRVVVVGGSQSAVEIALDLLDRFPRTRVDIVSRSWSLRAKDHSPFSEEIYFPDFTDHYYHAPVPHRRRLDAFTRPTNYSAADLDVLERLYLAQHEQQLEGTQRAFLHGDAEIAHVRPKPERVDLLLRHAVTGARTELAADLVLLATGFRDMGKGTTGEPHHPLLSGLAGVFRWTADGYLDVAEDYALVPTARDVPPVYLNGLCESTHGIGDAGSFSLLSLRAQIILRGLQQALAKVPA